MILLLSSGRGIENVHYVIASLATVANRHVGRQAGAPGSKHVCTYGIIQRVSEYFQRLSTDAKARYTSKVTSIGDQHRTKQ